MHTGLFHSVTSGVSAMDLNMIKPGTLIANKYTESLYKILGPIGSGGFGATFRAVDENNQDVCIKFLQDPESWLCESYFGTLMRGNRRVVNMIEYFPFTMEMGALSQALFALVFEFVPNGSLGDYLESKGRWPEQRARREIVALLKVLTQLHGGGALHRDLTPMNVLVGASGRLKLADFGIARHRVGDKNLTDDMHNPGFVSAFREACGARRHWLMADDVYQMGLLLGMLITGDVSSRITPRRIDRENCSEELKTIIKCAVGPRPSRYESAYEMLEALEGGEPVGPDRVRTLKNKKVVFTGPMTLHREDACVLVYQAGGDVQSGVRKNTNVVVVGGRSKLYKGAYRGKKLRELEKLNKAGAAIRMINETQFMRLVGGKRR